MDDLAATKQHLRKSINVLDNEKLGSIKKALEEVEAMKPLAGAIPEPGYMDALIEVTNGLTAIQNQLEATKNKLDIIAWIVSRVK